MTHIFLADALSIERMALRLMLHDLKMEVVGESVDWLTTIELAPLSKPNMLLIDWSLVPLDPQAGLAALRTACLDPVVIVLISHMNSRQAAALSPGADAFISKSETSEYVAEHLQTATDRLIK